MGFVLPDEEYVKMKAAWDACVDARVDIPVSVKEFFDGGYPHENGMLISVNHCISGYSRGDECWQELYVEDIPKNVKVLRFYVAEVI